MLFLHWTWHSHSRKFDLGCIFISLAEILGHTMPKFTICGGDSFTWLGQGMYIMLGCLFPFLCAIFADLWCIFSFLAEIPGSPMPKYSVCGVNIWTWPGQGMGTIFGCLFPSLWAIFADLGHIFPFWQRPLGYLCLNFLYMVETALLGLDQVWTSYLDVSFLFSGQFLLI